MKTFKPLICVLASVLLALPAFAVDTTTSEWTGATNATWSTTTNWTPNTIPSATVSAKFDAAFTSANQPNLTGGQTTQGIWLATGVTQDVTISGAQLLTITGTAILNGQTAAGIIMDDSADHKLTISTTTLGLSQNTGFYVNNAGTLTISGTVALGLRTLTLAGTNASGNIILNGPITSTGTAPGLVVNTAGTVTFAGTNTFGGTAGFLKLTAGTLNLNNTQAAGTKTFYIDGGTIDTTNGTAGLTAGNNVQQWRENFTFKGTSNFDLGTGVVTLAPTTGTTVNVTVTANKLTVGGAIGGVGKGITKLGAGTLTLSGSNTYTGATLVNVGTLIVNGTLASGGITVSTGATLGGNITAGGTTAIQSGGTLSVGNSPGTGNFSTLDLAGLTLMQFNPNPDRSLAGTDFDTINVSTALAYGGELRLNFAGTVANSATAFDLFAFGAVVPTGSFSSVTLFNGGGQVGGSLTNASGIWSGIADLGYGSGIQSFAFTQSTGDLLVTVPEPSTWAMLLAGVGMLGLWQRNRRRMAK